jgi:N-acetylneuraminic acid mutarotase
MQKPLLLLIFAAFVSALSAQEWVQKASLPDNAIPRNHPVTFSIDGIGYLTTGYIIDGSQYEQDMYRYDPVVDTWTELNDFPGASRGFSYGIATGGKGYMGFGVTDTAVLNDMWAYDPATDTWTQKASCPCLGRTGKFMWALVAAFRETSMIFGPTTLLPIPGSNAPISLPTNATTRFIFPLATMYMSDLVTGR